MATEFRSSLILINEAKLLASAPDTVAAWLEKSGEVSWWAKEADAELELNLLARNERLIDLALAEHGLSPEVLGQLFRRDDEIIRAAVLSNQRSLSSSKHYGSWFNHWKFLSDDLEPSWIAHLSNVEAEALFANGSLPDAFIADFFEQKDVWEALNDDQRLSAAHRIIETLKARQPVANGFDSWRDDRRSAMIDAAWRFSAKAPVDVFWAFALSKLYSFLPPRTILNFDPLQVTERWHVEDPDISELEGENRDIEYGYLSIVPSVRFGLARLASHSFKNRELILKNEDVAIRCGGYAALSLSVAEMEAAFATDGKLACNYLIENEKLWKYKKLRSALENICRKASQDEDYIVSQMADFIREEIRLRELHPNWFSNGLLTSLVKIQAKEKTWGFWIIIAFLTVILIKI
jgi:hypothetical protein